jgi:hypothetical protein
VVVGEAGSGKSSLVSALARPELVRSIERFISAVAFTSLSRSVAELAESLTAQLGRNLRFREAAGSYRSAFDDETYKVQPPFERLVLGPLRKMTVPVGERIRLAIDGIDQLDPEARTELIGLLASAANDPMLKRVGILISGRPSVRSELENLPDASLINIDRPRSDEIKTYLTSNRVPENLAEALVSHPWTWLELQLLTDLGSRLKGTPLGDRPFDLGALYDELIASAIATAGQDVKAVLVVLAAAGPGPNLPIGIAAAACSFVQASNAEWEGAAQMPRLRKVLADLGGMSVRADPGTDAEQLGLFHETFAQHIAVRRDWGLSVMDGHAAIVAALKDVSDPSAVAYHQTRGPDHLWALGDYHDALSTIISGLGYRAADNRSIIELWTERAREVLPAEDTDLLDLRGHLARWTGEAGKARDAITQYRLLLEDRTRILGPNHRETLNARSGLARWLGKSGKVTEAIEQSLLLLEDRTRVLGPNDPDTLAARHEHARWTAEDGNVTEAIALFTQLLIDRIWVLGPNHPATLKTRGNLARWTGEEGKTADAIEQFRLLLADRIQTLGPDHPHTMITRHDLARWTGRAGHVKEAAEQYRRLLADQSRLLGPDHPHTLATRHDLARWTGRAGNVKEAAEQCRRLLADQTRLLGPDHPHTLATRENLARWTGEMRQEAADA